MYVDSIPVSGFIETQGWRMPMPSPQPSGSLKRPPLLSNASPSSSLSGMEQAVPSFQSFICRTPPPDQSKPLPPTPLIPQRASSVSPPRSATPSVYSQRRSSSVYSRTVSQWFDDDTSCRSAYLRDDPKPEMPPLPILQPVAYSKSTSQLIQRPTAPTPFLEPRTYSPLIITPSPTASRVTTPNRSPASSPGASPLPQQQQQHQHQHQQQATMYPTSPPIHHAPRKQVQTVSLEHAKAAVHSPGAVHLLPEELRAQAHGKSRSDEFIRMPTSKVFESITATHPPMPPMPPPTLVDAQGSHRSLQAKTVDSVLGHPFPTIFGPPLLSPKVATPERAPLETQSGEASKAKAIASLGLGDDDEEPRGRTRERGSRTMDYSHYVPKGRRPISSPSRDEERSDAQRVASEYHHLLSEQYRQPSTSSTYDSDDSIRAHMKMVPQPLFKNKPAAKLPGSVSGRVSERGNNASESPFHLRAGSVASKASGRTQGSFPLRLSLTPDSVHRRTISPPTNAASVSPAPTGSFPYSIQMSKNPKPRRKSEYERVSMYYPYVGSRKGKKAKDKKAKEAERPVPPMSLLPEDIIAQRLQTPEASALSSPLHSTASVSFKDNTNYRKDSNASSERQRTPLFHRLAGNAVKYAELITRPSAMPEAHAHHPKPSDPTTTSQHSPHLLPSPVKSNPPPVHLGWSDTAKITFDRSRSSTQSASPPTPQSTQFTNLPARPLDERYTSETQRRGRKGSIAIFGGLLDSWKEKMREEKREELKKIIRVVPQPPPPQMQTRYIAPPGQGLVRQASMGTVLEQRASRPLSGGLGRRMSAFGWM